MARFVHWPSFQPVENNVLQVSQGSLKNIVTVAECDPDYKAKLVKSNGTDAAGSAELTEADRRGTVVPLILTGVQDGDQVQVLHKITGNAWSAPLTIHFISNVSTGPAVSAEVKTAVNDAVRGGRIRGDNGQIAACLKDGFFQGGKGLRFVLADAMYPVLASLAKGGVLDILSLMDDRGAPHGQAIADDLRVCWGMDIKGYAGFAINLVNGDNADSTIAGVAAVISNLPTGRYRFGLTRPSTQPRGPVMPDKDVFLPMDNMSQMYAHRPKEQILEPARTAILAAVAGNPRANIDGWFEDGVDHVHLEVWDGQPKH